MYKTIYMTGAPAAGKSTTAHELARRAPELEVFEYGAKLTEMMTQRRGATVVQDELREKSSLLITKEDVNALDEHLISHAAIARKRRHLLIDSHAVTKERYGFRITPFSSDFLQRLQISEIWVLFASAEETMRRISGSSGGRPLPTSWEADFHTQLQAGLAASYSVSAGVVLHLFDTNREMEPIILDLLERLRC